MLTDTYLSVIKRIKVLVLTDTNLSIIKLIKIFVLIDLAMQWKHAFVLECIHCNNYIASARFCIMQANNI